MLPVGRPGAPKERDWTILVYGGGVNNLDEAIRKNWEGADDQPLPENVDVLVRHFGTDGRTLDVHMTSEGTTVMDSMAPSANSSSPETLGEFLSEGVKKCPAKRFLAVVSSHGKGAEGVIEDDRAGRLMSPAGFKQALEAGKLANNGKPLDAVLFDACRMAAVEVACQLVGSVGVAIASMDNIASTGYSMAEVVRSAEASEDARELGEKLVYNDAPQQRGSCLTLSAIDLDRLQPLQTAIASLAEQLGKLQPETARSVRRVSELTRRNTASPDSWDLLDMLSDHILGSKTFDAQAFAQWMEARQPGPAVALVGFCANLLDQEALMTTHPQLKATLSDVIAAHDQAVFAARAADQDSWPGGLSITLPLSSTGGPLYKDGPLAFEQTTHWSRAVDVVVPAGEPAQHVPTWLEKELESRGVQTPAPPAA